VRNERNQCKGKADVFSGLRGGVQELALKIVHVCRLGNPYTLKRRLQTWFFRTVVITRKVKLNFLFKIIQRDFTVKIRIRKSVLEFTFLKFPVSQMFHIS
jgi:hypothetical protein